MALPIKYSYSGADCKAVAFYSSVDDYAYYMPKENDGFFVYTTTSKASLTRSDSGTDINLSSSDISKILKHTGDDSNYPVNITGTTNAFDAGLYNTSNSDYNKNDRGYLEGVKIRNNLKRKFEARYGKKSPPIIPLDSLATISYSIHEAKSPVRRLGYRGVSGYTRGIRTIAGSMVFLVIEDHPLSTLIELQRKSKNWSADLNSKGHSFRTVQKSGESTGITNFISTILEPFNIGLFYKTEVSFGYAGNESKVKKDVQKELSKPGYVRTSYDGAHLVISGIDIISEGMVTSVNDMVTEVTVQFVAQDVFNIEKVNYGVTKVSATNKNAEREDKNAKKRFKNQKLYKQQVEARKKK